MVPVALVSSYSSLWHLFSISSPATAKDQGTNQTYAPICFIWHYLMVMTPKRNSCRNTLLILWVVFSSCTLHSHPKARKIEGICWIEVSLGKISKEGKTSMLKALQVCIDYTLSILLQKCTVNAHWCFVILADFKHIKVTVNEPFKVILFMVLNVRFL